MKITPLVVGTIVSAIVHSSSVQASFLHHVQSTPPTKAAFNLNTAQKPSMRQPAQPFKLEDLEPEAIRNLWLGHIKNELAKDNSAAILTNLKHASPDTQKRWAAVNALLGEKSVVSDIDFSEILDKDEIENIDTLTKKAKETPENEGEIRIDDLI
jgi:hypothetical protein